MSDYDLHLLALAGALAAGAIGWQIVFGLAGALFLAAGTAMGLGAYAATLLPAQFGWPFGVAILAATALPAMTFGGLGLLIARLESHYLALATLAFAEAALLLAINWESVTGGANGLLGAPPPSFLEPPAAKAAAAWVAAALAAAAFYGFRRALGGPRLALLRAHPLAARAFGTDPTRARCLAMATAGAVGGVGGAAHALTVGVVSPDGLAFKTMATILAVVIIGGRRSPAAACLLAIAVTWTPELLRFLEQTYLIAYGALLLAAILFLPEGLAAVIAKAFPKPRNTPPRGAPPSLRPETPTASGVGFEARGLSRSFGGLNAVVDVDLDVRAGEVLGLIGPNGAGKSTLLNLLSGLDRLDAGAIDGERKRLGRTFQTPALAMELDALENVRAAAASDGAAWAALDEAGLTDKANAPIGKLTQAERRFLEFARARAARPEALLLDEPAAGLAEAERRLLARLIRRAADDGLAIVVVEHDVPFLTGLCDRLVCLSEGRVIAAGAPDDVRRSPAVAAAYFGAPAT